MQKNLHLEFDYFYLLQYNLHKLEDSFACILSIFLFVDLLFGIDLHFGK